MTPTIQTRGDRSRAAILGAFAELIFRDGFEGVSVQGIVAGAGIARSTFYEHFSSKDDVLRASMGQFLQVLAGCVSSDAQAPELLGVLSHFWGNRRLVDAIFVGTPRRILALSLSEMIEAGIRDLGMRLVLPLRLASIHLAEGQLALVESWLRGRAMASVDDVATALYQSSRASTKALIRSV